MTSSVINGALALSWARVCETGGRASNQDALGHATRDAQTCFVIADGTGGHAGGELAAATVVDAVLARFAAETSFGEGALLSCALHAIAQVARARQGAPHLAEMSATLAALVIDQDSGRAAWGHLGDTRIYLFRGGRLHSVTSDHSMAQQLVDAGYVRADKLRQHPQRNMLLAAIGAEGAVQVAVSNPVELLAGDAFLICSDGLWEWLEEQDMERTLAAHSGSEAWLAAMCNVADFAAVASGKARDNFSAWAIQVQARDPA